MSPADIIKHEFAKVELRDGTTVKAYVEHAEIVPISKDQAMQMILAASLLMEEAESHLPGRLRRRSELLRQLMFDAIEREGIQR